MKKESFGATGSPGPSSSLNEVLWTGPDGQINNQVEDNRDEIIKLLKSIDKNIKDINAKLK